MNNQNEFLNRSETPTFREGMTLDAYLAQMKTIPK